MSILSKLESSIEKWVAPLAGTLGQNRYLTAVKDGGLAALPFLIVGSFLLVFVFPPFPKDTTLSFARAWLDFSSNNFDTLFLPFRVSMGLTTFFMGVGIASSLARHYKLDQITSSLLALFGFLLIATPFVDGNMSTRFFSGEGIFTVIAVSIFTTELYRFLIEKNITIKLPEQVPEGVARSFELLIPVIAVMLILYPLSLLIQNLTGMMIPEAIMKVLAPLVSASDSLAAVVLVVVICNVLWFCGIHGSLLVTSLMGPFWLANLGGNQEALASGVEPTAVFLQGFWDHYLLIGGVGSTLPLCLLLIRSRAAHLRSVGKMSIIPGLFNINEPIMFGAPIVMNPVMFIPFLAVPIFNGILAYFMVDAGLVAKVVAVTPWTTPGPIGAAWAANWALSAFVLSAVCMVTAYTIYYPFFKAYEKTLALDEEKASAELDTQNT
ncbi:PTS sugar transporter subunit IIC [Endozoicomonas ascidiicola]|uniref:PTS sugar transporter subunit IIC n=1 Tax=Endozoicomonas ascidiicola TaxID=1698521 RepID=UPI000B01CB7C|nr:PTS sugar transporter subunit IIC [Endozoicomonas ascidiicola]